MKVAYQLRPLAAAHPAVALLVPGRQADDVLQLCAALGLDPLPAIHLVADGFLVKLPSAFDTPLAGVVRLRGLSADLLLPVDAELVPALLHDEAAALVRQRGLVFLPGGRVLEFDPNDALPLADLVQVAAVERRPWQALPEPQALADELTEIALEVPDTLPDDVLQPGGDGLGTESTEIPDTGLPSKVAGKALFGLGKGFAWLGKSLHLPGLTAFGATLLASAMSLMPRLSEQLLEKQEAMLRNLLRQFREGNIEEALKRALPLGEDFGRGSVPARDARLPTHDLFYSLVNLLGSRGSQGRASVWFGGGNTYQELLQEYRKQADQAAARGDFRRAAFIYGKLLRDFRSAALVLARGGLHRDAAMLYERALNDLPAAAREWETAGEIDRALQLYLKLGDHALAGDLLRRAGEEERAIAEYQLAAAKLVESGQRHYEAGQLLETRAQRPDLALPYYRSGWDGRPHGNPIPCVLRLAGHYAADGAGAPLLALTSEADAFLDAWDAESAATYYNALARHADAPVLATVAAELRDRARLGLARKLAQTGERRGGSYFATLFPAASPWPAPLIRDAALALEQASRRPTAVAGATWVRRRIRPSTVRAVHQLPASKEVFLGLESGEVLCYRPGTGDVFSIAQEKGPILSFGSCGADEYLVVLSQAGPQRISLAILTRSTGFRMLNYQHLAIEGPSWLCSHFEDQSSNLISVYAGRHFCLYRIPELVPQGPWWPLGDDEPVAVIMSPAPSSPRGAGLLALYPSRVAWYSPDRTPDWSAALPWTPSAGSDALTQPVLHAVWNDDGPLEILGLDGHGGLRLSRFRPGTPATPKTFSAWPGDDQPFFAFARLRASLLAGVTRTAVHWLRGTSSKPAAPPTPIQVMNPVAAFALPATDELLIVEADCSLTRVPIRG